MILILGNIIGYWVNTPKTRFAGKETSFRSWFVRVSTTKCRAKNRKSSAFRSYSSVNWFLKKKIPFPPQLFGNSRQFLRKWRQKECFLGTFEHQRRNRYIPIYRTRYSRTHIWYRIGQTRRWYCPITNIIPIFLYQFASLLSFYEGSQDRRPPSP